MKRLIVLFVIVFMLGCGGGESNLTEKPEIFEVTELASVLIPISHAYNSVVNADPSFRKTIVFFDLTLFLYGSYETGKAWWNETHPYYYFYDEDPFFAIYLYTGKHQVWFPVKVDDQGMVWIKPYDFAHEFTHFLTMLDEQILSSDKWGY